MTPTTEILAAAPPANLLRSFAAVEIHAAAGESKRPTFEIVGYTGAAMNVAGFYSPVVVDLAGLRATGQEIPVLYNHDPTRIVGQTTAVAIGKDVKLSGTVTGENADATEVVTQARNGFRWQASIGASVDRREFLDAGKTAVVNGREFAGPLVIARESTLKEISFVALGADPQTSASVAASSPGSPISESDMNFDAWLQAKGFDPAALSDTQRNTLRAMYDHEHPPAAPAPAPAPAAQPVQVQAASLDQILAEARREEQRQAEITRITAEAITARPMMLDELERMSRAAVEARTSPLEYELTILRQTRAPAGPMGLFKRDRKATGKVIEAAICLAGGLEKPEKHFDEQTLNAADERFPHGLGLRDLLMMAARENGYTGPTSSDVRGLLKAAFVPAGPMIYADGFSTNSLPGILGNTANKFLAMGFNAIESTWRSISAVRNVRDFKTVTSYSLTGGAMYEKVGPAGELKHATVGEQSYTNKADTYGRMFAITRQDIINDDLGALTQVPMKLGRGAALKLNDVFWTAYMSVLGTTFTSGRGNYLSGVTVGTNDSRLNDEGLTRATAQFRNQTDPDGYPLGIAPKILLVPNALEVPAKQLMTSTEIRTSIANTTMGTTNVWAGLYTPVTSSYLSNSSYTGYSTTAWYLLADPQELAISEVAFLNGRQEPVVESADAEFNTLGIQFRGYHDFGVGIQEYRAGVMSKGAA